MKFERALALSSSPRVFRQSERPKKRISSTIVFDLLQEKSKGPIGYLYEIKSEMRLVRLTEELDAQADRDRDALKKKTVQLQ